MKINFDSPIQIATWHSQTQRSLITPAKFKKSSYLPLPLPGPLYGELARDPFCVLTFSKNFSLKEFLQEKKSSPPPFGINGKGPFLLERATKSNNIFTGILPFQQRGGWGEGLSQSEVLYKRELYLSDCVSWKFRPGFTQEQLSGQSPGSDFYAFDFSEAVFAFSFLNT